MAHQARAYIGAVFAFGLKATYDYTRKSPGLHWGIKANPVLAIMANKSAKRARDRNLSAAEFRAFWNWLLDYDAKSSAAAALRLMMATGQRTEEILRLGFESRYSTQERMLIWDHTKNGLPHAIPLPRQAVAIIEALTPNERGLYFPNRYDVARPMDRDSPGWVIGKYVSERKCAPFCARDIRRTWKTLAGAAGIPKEMRDRLQNHARTDVSSRHYDRYEYLADERAVAAALVEPWSNGQTEGQITKLKLVKRQMYGRAKLDLLRARLLGTGDSMSDLHRNNTLPRIRRPRARRDTMARCTARPRRTAGKPLSIAPPLILKR